MTRRFHRRRSLKRRQLNPLFSDDPSEPSTPNSSSSSDTAQSDPPTGNSATGNGRGNPADNDPTGSGGLPIGRPNNPNPIVSPSPSSNLPPAATSSDPVPSVDPFPPKGANQPPVSSSSTSSNALSKTAVVPSTPTSSISSTSSSSISSSLSSISSLIHSPTSSPIAVTTSNTPVLPSSKSVGFDPNTALSLAVPHSTITALSLPTPTSTSPPSSSAISTPAIVGIAAGGFCGLALLGAACLWIGKRVSRYVETRELEPPPMHEPIADDDSAVISRRPSGPRPPTMIERKQANLAGRGNGFYNNNNGFPPQNNFSSYAADPRFGNATPFAPGQYYPTPPVNPPVFQPYFNPIATTSPFDDAAAAVPSTPGTPVYFSRQNSMQSGFANVPNSDDSQVQLPNPYDTPVARPNDGYATLNRGSNSVTPQQARLYTDLARQLDLPPEGRTTSPVPSTGSYAAVPLLHNNNNVGIPTSPRSPSFKAVPKSPSVVSVPTDLHEGRATPVQFGFTEPAAVAPATHTVHVQPVSQPANPVSQPARPETMYDEEDAYAAI